MDKSRMEMQFDFLRELDRQKQIVRQTYLADGSRKEDDAEHAWHMAVMAILLSEYSNEEINLLKTVTMILLHDAVEIYAGDTYAHGGADKSEQHEREAAAAEKLFGLLPEDQGVKLRALWEEFEERTTPESKFANTMDNIQPTMLNAASGGKSWKEHGVTYEQVMKRQSYTPDGSEKLWKYSYEHFIEPNVKKGNITK